MPGSGTRYVFFPENDKKVCFAFAWSLVVLHHPIINNALELYQKGSLFFAAIAVPLAQLTQCHTKQFHKNGHNSK